MIIGAGLKVHIRLLLESIIVSLGIMITISIVQVVKGIILTLKYVPDIVHSYESVEMLSSSVSLPSNSSLLVNVLQVVISPGLVVLGIVYYILRLLYIKLKWSRYRGGNRDE